MDGASFVVAGITSRKGFIQYLQEHNSTSPNPHPWNRDTRPEALLTSISLQTIPAGHAVLGLKADLGYWLKVYLPDEQYGEIYFGQQELPFLWLYTLLDEGKQEEIIKRLAEMLGVESDPFWLEGTHAGHWDFVRDGYGFGYRNKVYYHPSGTEFPIRPKFPHDKERKAILPMAKISVVCSGGTRQPEVRAPFLPKPTPLYRPSLARLCQYAQSDEEENIPVMLTDSIELARPCPKRSHSVEIKACKFCARGGK